LVPNFFDISYAQSASRKDKHGTPFLARAFYFEETGQGFDFWNSEYQRVISGEGLTELASRELENMIGDAQNEISLGLRKNGQDKHYTVSRRK
jgi:hypothetical protein